MYRTQTLTYVVYRIIIVTLQHYYLSTVNGGTAGTTLQRDANAIERAVLTIVQTECDITSFTLKFVKLIIDTRIVRDHQRVAFVPKVWTNSYRTKNLFFR